MSDFNGQKDYKYAGFLKSVQCSVYTTFKSSRDKMQRNKNFTGIYKIYLPVFICGSVWKFCTWFETFKKHQTFSLGNEIIYGISPTDIVSNENIVLLKLFLRNYLRIVLPFTFFFFIQ